MFLQLSVFFALLFASIEGVAAGERVGVEGSAMSVALPPGWTLAAGASDVDGPTSLVYVFTDTGGGYRSLRAQVRLEQIRGERVPKSWSEVREKCAELPPVEGVCASLAVAGFDGVETVSRSTMIADGPVEADGGRRSSRSETVTDEIVLHVGTDFYYYAMTVMPGQDATLLKTELHQFCSSLKPSEPNA